MNLFFIIIIYIFEFKLVYTEWNVPVYNSENIKWLKNDDNFELKSTFKESENTREFKNKLSIEETYFRHIIRKIVQNGDPYVKSYFKTYDGQNNDDQNIEFILQLNSKIILELKKLITLFDNEQVIF